MNEFIVLFRSNDAADNAGLREEYLTQVGPMLATRLRMHNVPWTMLRECLAFAQIQRDERLAVQIVDDNYFHQHVVYTALLAAQQQCHPINIYLE